MYTFPQCQKTAQCGNGHQLPYEYSKMNATRAKKRYPYVENNCEHMYIHTIIWILQFMCKAHKKV